MIKRIITKFLLVSLIAFTLISLRATIYVVYLAGADLSFKEVSLVNLFYLLVLFLMEIPSKIVINLFGRKTSLSVSAVLYGIGFGLYSSAYSLLGFISAEIFVATGTVLTSISLKSWLTNSLDFSRQKKKSIDVAQCSRKIICFAKLIAGFSGIYLGAKNLSLTFVIVGLGYWSLMISSLLTKERVHLQDVRMKETSLLDTKVITQESIAYAWQDDLIFIIIGLTIIIALGFLPTSMIWRLGYYSSFTRRHILLCLLFLIIGSIFLSRKMTKLCPTRSYHSRKTGLLTEVLRFS